MSVLSLKPDYQGPTRDRVENFHGNVLVYVHWEEHLNFCAAITLPLAPDTPFDALVDDILPSLYSGDPAWVTIEPEGVRWVLDGNDWTPARGKTLQELGVGHKSLIRFWTPAFAEA
jgi:phenol hydroxylase P4 protein